MRHLLLLILLLSPYLFKGQQNALCFVTSIKGDVRYANHSTVRVGDTISFSRLPQLAFYTKGMITLYSTMGTCRVYTSEEYSTHEQTNLVEFAKEVLRVKAKAVPLSSRGDCMCAIPEECLSTDPGINENLLLLDTLSFAAFNILSADSFFYFLQWKSPQGTVLNNRLKIENGVVSITENDLKFKGKFYNESGKEILTLGLCRYFEGQLRSSTVTRLRIEHVKPQFIRDYYTSLKNAMPNKSPDEVYQTLYTDLYVFYGKPNHCQLKKLINYPLQ